MSKNAGINNAEITSGQCAKLYILFALGSSALILPTVVIEIAKQDAWLTMLLAGPINYLVLMIYLALADRFPNLSLVQYMEKLIGKWAAKALMLTYVLFFLVNSALVLRNISDFLGLSVLPITPTWFIDAIFMLVVIYGVCLGIETMARTGEILYFWSTFVIFIILIALLYQLDYKNFEPLLYNGILRPIKGLYPILGFPIGEFVFITMIFPLVRKTDRKKLRKSLKLATVMITAYSVLLTLFLIGVMGVDESSRSPFAVYDLAKNINIEEILVRVEILVAMIWIGTIFMKLVLCVYVLSVSTAQLLGLSNYRPLVVPFGFVVLPLSLIIYRNIAHARVFSAGVWTVYSVFQGYVLPLLLLIIAVIMKKRDNSEGNSFENRYQANESIGDNKSGDETDSIATKEPAPT
ncbi:spore germination protein KB [Paenibacillus castaneae]|uniref:GerAB/ArcD/ProY family transporter n=1 Tax=Paenibacillus castaneae TaxID=474957 RepID=UPI000C9AD59A|nr:endospore germination permease [Paenibacillus castaneae]NIK79402.1 spore germination protein KB [Paenibacillus castaneae]